MRTTLGICASATPLRNSPRQNRPMKGEYRIDASLWCKTWHIFAVVSVTEPLAKSECQRRLQHFNRPGAESYFSARRAVTDAVGEFEPQSWIGANGAHASSMVSMTACASGLSRLAIPNTIS